MYIYRNQLSDVDIYPSYFHFLFHPDVGEDRGRGVGAQGEYRGGVQEAGKGRVPGSWGFSKGERTGRN